MTRTNNYGYYLCYTKKEKTGQCVENTLPAMANASAARGNIIIAQQSRLRKSYAAFLFG
jgi:hypothetical protein